LSAGPLIVFGGRSRRPNACRCFFFFSFFFFSLKLKIAPQSRALVPRSD